MKIILLCLLVIPFYQSGITQNLVPNPSFEDYHDCPSQIGFQGLSKPIDWEKWNQSPEYFHVCAQPINGSDTLLAVPQNGFGFQYAWDGEAYVGMAVYDGANDFREYVGCELLMPLQVGQTYYLSLYYNMAMGGNYWAPVWASNNMGMLFTMESNIWSGITGPPFDLRNYAHLHDPIVNTDTAGWTLLSGSFVADSAYQYVVLGNFFSDTLTDTIHLAGSSSLSPYVFVDGVCVSPNPDDCPLVNGVENETDVESLLAFPNPTNNFIEIKIPSGVEWELYNSIGELIRTGSARGPQLNLSMQDEPDGQYLIVLRGEATSHVKFIVMR